MIVDNRKRKTANMYKLKSYYESVESVIINKEDSGNIPIDHFANMYKLLIDESYELHKDNEHIQYVKSIGIPDSGGARSIIIVIWMLTAQVIAAINNECIQ